VRRQYPNYHRTKQTTIHTGLAGDGDGSTVHLVGNSLSSSQLFSGQLFKFSTARFELGHGSGRCALGHALRNQKVSSVAILDFDDIAQLPRLTTFSSRMICMFRLLENY
jgi:hypothetical protein